MREKDSAVTGEFRQGLSLSVKIYILIIVIIVTVSVALVFTGYRVFCQKIDEEYYSRGSRAVSAASEFLTTDFLNHFWQAAQSEDYLQVKQKAIAAGDQGILLQWMRKQRPMRGKRGGHVCVGLAGDTGSENRDHALLQCRA